MGRIFSGAERFESRNVEMHLARRFTARSHQELEFQPVDRHLLAGFGNPVRRKDEGRRCVGSGNSKAGAQGLIGAGAALEDESVLVAGAPDHGIARIEVLAHRFFGEARRSNHLGLSGSDIFRRRHGSHAAEMVDMTVRIDDCGYGLLRSMLEIEVEGRLGRMGRRRRIDDNQARFAFDDRQVGNVKAPDLVEAVHHFEQA